MTKQRRISVCLAVCGWSPYLNTQIASILGQDRLPDELVVVEDPGGLSPRSAIEQWCAACSVPVRYIGNAENVGPAETFRRAILASQGDLIVLSDQDDLWKPGKLSCVEKVLESVQLVVHNGICLGSDHKFSDGALVYSRSPLSDGSLIGFSKGLSKNSVVGATMAFDGHWGRHFAQNHSFLPMHDWVLAILFQRYGLSTAFVDHNLIIYRRHGSSFTAHSGWLKPLRKIRRAFTSRAQLLRSVFYVKPPSN